MSEEKLVRFNLMISPKQLEEIDEYRKDIGTLPPRGAAVRDLIRLGLEAHKNVSKGRD